MHASKPRRPIDVGNDGGRRDNRHTHNTARSYTINQLYGDAHTQASGGWLDSPLTQTPPQCNPTPIHNYDTFDVINKPTPTIHDATSLV